MSTPPIGPKDSLQWFLDDVEDQIVTNKDEDQKVEEEFRPPSMTQEEKTMYQNIIALWQARKKDPAKPES